jgi:hypothetical protein
MAATNFTPISLYYTTTAAAAPSAGNLVNGELAINITDGKLYYKDNLGAVKLLASNSGAAGDVVGPASATDNAIPTFDGTTGKLIKNNSGVTISAGVITASGFSGNATSATNLAGGAASRIPYQTGSGATAFLPNGTTGQVLTSNGASAPTWNTPSGITTGKSIAMAMIFGF